MAIDEDGRSLLINKKQSVLLHRFSFKGPVKAAEFSPDGRFIACAVGRVLQVKPILTDLYASIACLQHCSACINPLLPPSLTPAHASLAYSALHTAYLQVLEAVAKPADVIVNCKWTARWLSPIDPA